MCLLPLSLVGREEGKVQPGLVHCIQLCYEGPPLLHLCVCTFGSPSPPSLAFLWLLTTTYDMQREQLHLIFAVILAYVTQTADTCNQPVLYCILETMLRVENNMLERA